MARESISDLLHRLRSRADIVLVDTPPLLNVGDAITLSEAVDGVLLVVRPNVTRRDDLGELRRILSSAQADTLGFVLTGSRPAEMPGYGSYTRGSRVGLGRLDTRRISLHRTGCTGPKESPVTIAGSSSIA